MVRLMFREGFGENFLFICFGDCVDKLKNFFELAKLGNMLLFYSLEIGIKSLHYIHNNLLGSFYRVCLLNSRPTPFCRLLRQAGDSSIF